jgi:hypothetical protein
MIISVLSGILLSSALLAPKNTSILPLSLHQFTQEELDSVPLANVGFFQMGRLSTNLKQYKLPPGFKPVFEMPFFVISKMTVALAEQNPGGKGIKRVWIDWNGNDKAEASEFASKTGTIKRLEGSFDVLRFAGPNKTKKGPVYVQLIVESNMIAFIPTACGEATTTMGGKQVILRVIDSNMDGRYEGDPHQHGDQVVVAKKSESGQTATDYQLPLNSLTWLPDQRYYLTTVSMDGKNLILTRDELPLGQIQVKGKDLSNLSFKQGHSTIYPRIDNGIAFAPEGTYELRSAEATRQGLDGLEYRCSFTAKRPLSSIVKGNQTIVFDFDSPVSMSVLASPENDERRFELSLDTKGGIHVQSACPITSESRGNGMKAPELVILDAQGNIVDTLVFNLEPVLHPTTSWKPKASVKKGEYTAKAKWQTGAFGDLTAETKFKVE